MNPDDLKLKLGVLIICTESRTFQMENQVVRAIPFGKLQKYGL